MATIKRLAVSISALLTIVATIPACCRSVAVPKLYPNWTSYTNANHIKSMVFDKKGNLWTVGEGGCRALEYQDRFIRQIHI
jgi:ligand-binding sensor domain-containing protein